MTAFHRAEIALKLKDTIAAKAKERRLSTLRQNTDTVTLPERECCKETRQELAEIANTGARTLGKIEYITEHADEETKNKLRRGEKGTSINKEYNRLKAEGKPKTQAGEVKEAEDAEGEFYPEPPCPNKDVKYFPQTTLKNIPQEPPHALLANLFAHFRKGFVEELVVMAMEKIREKLGKTAVNKILRELNKRYGK